MIVSNIERFNSLIAFIFANMKIYEPLAVALFVVVVLTSSYMLGKRIGYDQGWEKANSDAFAEGHIAGFNDALDTFATDGSDGSGGGGSQSN